MPMYFPDLKNIQKLANDMAENTGIHKYTGLYPKTEEELPEARKQLAGYMRRVWNDEIFALEIELAVSPEDYELKMGGQVRRNFV